MDTKVVPLACLLLLSLLFGCGETLFAPDANSNQTATASQYPDDNPTSGAIVRSTREAEETRASEATATMQTAIAAGTATSAAQATGTAQVRDAATLTVAARATAQFISQAKSKWKNVLLASFSENHLGWETGLKQDSFLSVFTFLGDGKYHWTTNVAHGNSYFNFIPQASPTLTDFYAQVTLNSPVANEESQLAYGITFRHLKDDYGFFGIVKAGQFRALEVHHTGVNQWLEETSDAIDRAPGHTNRIAVASIGSDFLFFINDLQVAQMSEDLPAGQFGLGVDAINSESEDHVEFSDFQVDAP